MSSPSNIISAEQLAAKLDDRDTRVVDCRFDLGDPDAGRQAYEAGHIRGAVFADLDSDLAGPIRPDTGRHPLPEPASLAAALGRLGIGSETDVVVYDAGPGALAARAWWLLRWLGHGRVRLLDGGFEQWSAEERPVSAGEERVGRRDFLGAPRDDMVVTTAELARNTDAIVDMNLLDARDEARFRGELEPIDPVAGHIPGAGNFPFSKSLDKNGRWKTSADLRRLWQKALGDDRKTPWVAMCGSGVTACHIAISALEAGYREPRLYVGSWSEWIRDPGRSIASGDGPEAGREPADLP